MKYLLLLTILSLFIVGCENPDIIIVRAGIGIDNLTFINSDTADIYNYKGLSYTKETGTALAEGDDFECYENWTKLYNDSLGITFAFSTPCLENVDTVRQNFVNISLFGTSNACLSENLCIGSATTQDVIKNLGAPENTFKQMSGQVFIHYKYLQLAFSNDTLNWIKVFTNQRINEHVK